jgi:hypothetical protein
MVTANKNKQKVVPDICNLRTMKGATLRATMSYIFECFIKVWELLRDVKKG